MGRPKASSIDVETPERLLAAAETEFAASGFSRATLQQIAERAGITRPALLYHFETKEDLYEAVVGRAFAALSGIVLSAMSQPGAFEERLHNVVDGFLTYVAVHPQLARIVVRALVDDEAHVRDTVLAFAAPLVDEVVRFVDAARTQAHVHAKMPTRAALMAVVSDVFLKTAAGTNTKSALWGDGEHAWAVTRSLLLPNSSR